MKHKQFKGLVVNCLLSILLLPFSANAAVYYKSVTMTEGETITLNAWPLSESQYDVGAKTWIGATSNIVVLQTSDYSAKILALSPGYAQIRHNRVYYNNGQNYDNIYFEITINKSSYPKIQLTPSVQSNRVLKGTVLTLTPSVSGSTIYYSTSGSVTPGKSSVFPSSGLTLNSTTTIRAQAVKSAYPLSDVFEHTYTVIPNSDFQTKVAGGATLHFKILNESVKTCQLYFVPDTEIGELTIPEQVNGYTVKEVGSQACLDCSKLTKINLPNTITFIGTEAFKGCTSLKSINIPEGVTSINKNTFNGCSSLVSIELPKRLSSIKSSAFYGCTALSSVIIPKTVTSIETSAFAGCPNLKSITTYIQTPFAIADDVFTTYNNSVTLSVPLGSATKYRSTSGWMQFVNINEVPDPDITYVTGITLNETEIELLEDDGKMLKATVTPTDATDKTVTWTTSNIQVATVSANGLVIGIKEGSATITCSANDNSGVNATCTVTVKRKPVSVSQIILNKSTLTIEKFKEYQLIATVKPDDATNKDVTWTTDNDQVVDVNDTGMITALSEGTATITCTSVDVSSVKATCVVTVIPRQVPVTDISLNKTEISLYESEKEQLTATLSPDNASIKTVTWASNNQTVATVSNEGLVEAIAEGSAIITCSANDNSGVKAICSVTVKKRNVPVSQIILNKSTLTLEKFEEYQLIATVKPDNATNKGISWSSDHTNIATVDSNGKVTALSVGTAIITCEAIDGSGVASMCDVTVTNATPPPPPSTPMLSIENFTITSNAEAAMVIDLTNPNDEITLVQFDLCLPVGLTIKKTNGEYDIDIADSNRTTWRKHSLDAYAQADGSIRFLLSSSSNAILSGIDGAIITITLVADNNYKEGPILIKNILLVTPDEKEITPTDVEYLPTGIWGVKMVLTNDNVSTYSLSGQRLTAPRKGINIIGGKKVVVR